MRNVLLIAAGLLAACASTPESVEMSTVVPRPGDEYDVASRWRSKEQALQWALGAAEHTCARRGMRFVVLDQQYAYKGIVPERTNQIVDLATDATTTAAAVAGHLPVVAGFTGSLRGRGDHTVQIRVRCEGTA